MIRRLDQFISKCEEIVLVGFLLGMLVLAFLSMFLRKFSVGIFWSEEVLKHLVLWIGLMGASLATKFQQHIKMDALSFYFPKYTTLLNRIAYLFSAIACFILCYASVKFVWTEYQFASKLEFGWPTWIFQLILPISFCIIGLRFLCSALLKHYSSSKNEDLLTHV